MHIAVKNTTVNQNSYTYQEVKPLTKINKMLFKGEIKENKIARYRNMQFITHFIPHRIDIIRLC
jgi:hypothetical protein